MMGQDYLSVEWDSTSEAWLVMDSQGVIDTYSDRKEAARDAIRIGSQYQQYGTVEVYDKQGEFVDSIQVAGPQSGAGQMNQMVGQTLMLGGGLMLGVGAMDAMGDMF